METYWEWELNVKIESELKKLGYQVKVSKRLTELYEELWLIERNLWACDNYIRDKDKESVVAK